MMRLALAALMLLGCVAEVPPAPAPERNLPEACEMETDTPDPSWPTPELALMVWGEYPALCLEEATQMRWVLVPDDDEVMARLCEYGESYACTRACVGLPTIVIRDATADRYMWLIAHELTHWLFFCSGLDGSNLAHDDPRFDATVKGIMRAQEMMTK